MSQALLPMELWGCCLGPIAGLLTPSTHAEPLRHRLWASLPGWGEEAQDPGKAPDSRREPQGPERREHSQPGSTEGRWKQGGFWEGEVHRARPDTHRDTSRVRAGQGQTEGRQRPRHEGKDCARQESWHRSKGHHQGEPCTATVIHPL